MIKRLILTLLLGFVPAFTSYSLYAAEATTSQMQVVNINKADAATLAKALDGVGKSRAQEIVRYRDAYGPFLTVDDLLLVRG